MNFIHIQYLKVYQCPVNMDILTPKIEAFQMNPKNQIAVFTSMALMILIKFHRYAKIISE
jgi:hypothetical protein